MLHFRSLPLGSIGLNFFEQLLLSLYLRNLPSVGRCNTTTKEIVEVEKVEEPKSYNVRSYILKDIFWELFANYQLWTMFQHLWLKSRVCFVDSICNRVFFNGISS